MIYFNGLTSASCLGASKSLHEAECGPGRLSNVRCVTGKRSIRIEAPAEVIAPAVQSDLGELNPKSQRTLVRRAPAGRPPSESSQRSVDFRAPLPSVAPVALMCGAGQER